MVHHMPHRLALLGCLGIVARASLKQSTACSGEQDAEVSAGEDPMTNELTA